MSYELFDKPLKFFSIFNKKVVSRKSLENNVSTPYLELNELFIMIF